MRARAVKLGKTLIAFSKDDCRDFAVAFQAAVPREIRDEVYTLLFTAMEDRFKTSNGIRHNQDYSKAH
jgi:hypothetical protein